MIRYFRDNKQFLMLIGLLVGVGIYFSVAAYVVLLIVIYLLWRNNLFTELLLGFILTLVLSDNLIESFSFPVVQDRPFGFAKTLKYEYMVLLFGILIVDRDKFRPYNKLILPFLPFLLIALISFTAFPSEGPVSPFESIARLLSYALLFITIPNYVQLCFRLEKEMFLKKLIYFLLIILVSGYLLRFVDIEHAFSHLTRFRGWFGNPNGLGIFVILVLALVLITNAYFPSLLSRTERRLAYVGIIAIVFMTDSRNALVCSLVLIAFANFSSISPFFAIMLAIVTAFLVPIMVANLPTIVELFGLGEFFRIETLEEGSGRFIAWSFAWADIQSSPLLGRGFAYDLNLMRSNFDMLSRMGHEGGVHNTYLILWLNTGLLGLIAFFRAFFLQFIRASKNTKLALPIMLAVMVSIIFEPWLAASLNPFTILFLIALTIITEKEFVVMPTLQSDATETQKMEGAAA